MLLHARTARRAATVFLTAAFGVLVFAADVVIGTWMSGAGPSAKTYGVKTHDNTFIDTVSGPCDFARQVRSGCREDSRLRRGG